MYVVALLEQYWDSPDDGGIPEVRQDQPTEAIDHPNVSAILLEDSGDGLYRAIRASGSEIPRERSLAE